MPALGLYACFLSGVLGLESTLSRGKEEISEDIALWRTGTLPDADPVIRQAIVGAAGAEAAEQVQKAETEALASFADLDESMWHGVLTPKTKQERDAVLDKSPWLKGLANWKRATGGAGAVSPLVWYKFVPFFLKKCEELDSKQSVAQLSNVWPRNLPDDLSFEGTEELAGKYLENPLDAWSAVLGGEERAAKFGDPVDLIGKHMSWMFGNGGSAGNYFVQANADAGAEITLTNKGRFYYGPQGDRWPDLRGPAKEPYNTDFAKPNQGSKLLDGSNKYDDQVVDALAELHYRFFFHQVFLPTFVTERQSSA